MIFNDTFKYTQADSLGYNYREDCFIMSNGIISDNTFLKPNKYGLVNRLYIPSAAEENKWNPDFLTLKKYEYMEGSKYKKASHWFKDMSRIHGRDVSLVSLAFVVASLNFDIISRSLKFFPLLCIAGQKGSGKGTFIKCVLNLFASDPDQVMINNSTYKAFMRKLEQVANVPVWFDEFKNNLGIKEIEALKNIYDIRGRSTAVKSNDNKTSQGRVLSPVILSGQEIPMDEALLSRCLTFQLDVKSSSTTEEAIEVDKFTEECERGLGLVLTELIGHRNHIKNNYKDTYIRVRSLLHQKVTEKKGKVNGRLLNIYGCVLSALICAIDNGLKLHFLSSYNEVDCNPILADIFADCVMRQSELESNRDEVMVFWNIFESMIDKNIIKEDIDYCIDREKGEFYFHSIIFDEYKKYYWDVHKEHSVDIDSLRNYLKQKKYYDQDSKKNNIRYYKVRKEGKKERRKRSLVFMIDKMEDLELEFL